MQKPATYHVIPNTAGGWAIAHSETGEATAQFTDKQEAIKKALELSQKENTELYIHAKDGRIHYKASN